MIINLFDNSIERFKKKKIKIKNIIQRLLPTYAYANSLS